MRAPKSRAGITRSGVVALVAGLALLVAACSSSDAPPDGLAFQEQNPEICDETALVDQDENLRSDCEQVPSSSSSIVVDETTSTTTTAQETTTTVPGTPRPSNYTCSSADYYLTFTDDIALTDPRNPSAGPFSISVPAGTYEVNVASWLGWVDEPEHTGEQWYILADNGYTSPYTTDSSPVLVTADRWTDQVISSGITSITLYHRQPGQPHINSVHPLCVGFTRVEEPVETTTTTTTTTAAPTTTTEATTTTAGQVLAQTTTTTAAPTTTAAVEPAELALTGAGDLSMSIGLAGAALTLAGLAALAAARRSEDDELV